jgi:hypothetical protein
VNVVSEGEPGVDAGGVVAPAKLSVRQEIVFADFEDDASGYDFFQTFRQRLEE